MKISKNGQRHVYHFLTRNLLLWGVKVHYDGKRRLQKTNYSLKIQLFLKTECDMAESELKEPKEVFLNGT